MVTVLDKDIREGLDVGILVTHKSAPFQSGLSVWEVENISRM